ncbi:hypothetical protein LINGRAHAP2_LOCUS29238 [Linum grandiflorum]
MSFGSFSSQVRRRWVGCSGWDDGDSEIEILRLTGGSRLRGDRVCRLTEEWCGLE